jgi:hypothetical protein
LWRGRNPKKLRPRPLVAECRNDPRSTTSARRDAIVKLVDQLVETKQKLGAAKTDAESNHVELLCSSLDRQIDEAVYELCGLNEEEIRLVEGA